MDKKKQDLLPPLQLRIKGTGIVVATDKRCPVQLTDHLIRLLQAELIREETPEQQLVRAEIIVARELRRLVQAGRVVCANGVWLAQVPILEEAP